MEEEEVEGEGKGAGNVPKYYLHYLYVWRTDHYEQDKEDEEEGVV